MKEIWIFQVDAFASRLFAGNPAAVCPLESWLPDRTLQAIARENNLSETAFFLRAPSRSSAEGEVFELRWFTPATEVDLCGHATLATAYVLRHFFSPGRELLKFRTRSGLLSVRSEGELLELDFPERRLEEAPLAPELAAVLGFEPLGAFSVVDRPIRMVLAESEEQVRRIQPDLAALGKLGLSVSVTARGSEVDFVSRYFAPARGIPEDPVTGSAHCFLVPYWSGILGKAELKARQVSSRGGELRCRLEGGRVRMAGHAALYMKGTISLPEEDE